LLFACQTTFVLLDRVAFLVEWLDPQVFGACDRHHPLVGRLPDQASGGLG
jgi:hypothetical protein